MHLPCDVSFSCDLLDPAEGEHLIREAADRFQAQVEQIEDIGMTRVMLQECGLRTYLSFCKGRITLVANSPDGNYEQQLSACACATSRLGELGERITGRIHAKANFVGRNIDDPDVDPVTLDLLNLDDFIDGSLRSAVGRWHPGLN